ncbi:MAG TPA: ATP-binding cassette domain-containing protein, partial [Gemmatimonadales bacterium]|nr:ATP-binding cassette domain-containing protein [Gemmatimonadales bacterium]
MSETTTAGEWADRRAGGVQPRPAPPAASPSGRPIVVESQAYSFWYGPTQALHEISCTIPRNAITALIGPSGCGKTT